MNIKLLIAAEDVLTSELENIYGGNESVEVVCKGDGVVKLPSTTEKGNTILKVF